MSEKRCSLVVVGCKGEGGKALKVLNVCRCEVGTQDY